MKLLKPIALLSALATIALANPLTDKIQEEFDPSKSGVQIIKAEMLHGVTTRERNIIVLKDKSCLFSGSVSETINLGEKMKSFVRIRGISCNKKGNFIVSYGYLFNTKTLEDGIEAIKVGTEDIFYPYAKPSNDIAVVILGSEKVTQENPKETK